MTSLNNTVIINDVIYDVIVREPAKGVTPVSGGEAVLIKTVDMLLLSNDEVVFQCVHPAAFGKCGYVAKAVTSVTAHQRSHGAKAVARKAAAKLDAMEKKNREEYARRSASATAANDAKKRRHAAEITSTDSRIAKIQRGLSDLAAGIDKVAAALPTLTSQLRALNAELGEIVLASLAKEAEVDVDKMSTEEKFRLVKKLMS